MRVRVRVYNMKRKDNSVQEIRHAPLLMTTAIVAVIVMMIESQNESPSDEGLVIDKNEDI